MCFRRKRKLSEFLLDSFRQNYVPADPLNYFYDKLHNGYEFKGISTPQDLRIGQFEPGERLYTVKKKLDVYDSTRTVLDRDNTLTSLLTVDELEQILRVSVYHFINQSLFSLNFHFPFISPEEDSFLMKLIADKYLPGQIKEMSDFTRIIGNNHVVILLDHFVSISYEFIHAHPDNIRLISKMAEQQLNLENIQEKQRRRELLNEI